MMGECEFGVTDKEPTTTTTTKSNNNISSTSSGCVLGSGVKLQNLQNKMTMMLHHHNHNHNHNRPFDNDDDGPTTYYMSSATLGAAHAHGGSAVMRPLQPFHISAYSSAPTTTTLKSPGGCYGMAASLGFPFTTAQWKELQRQAMIYKYITAASIPVPSHLLIPTTTIPTSLDGGFNLRLSRSNNDPEPGRCRRTDGKKWRCARDVAPNHKYCERHMHRGRPRSRKPVEEVQQPNNNNNNNQHQIKKPRHDPNPKFTVANTATKDGSSYQFHDDNYFGVKGFNFGSVPPVSSNKQPRGLEWMLNGDPISLGASSDSGWQSLMHNKLETNTGGSCNNTEPHYQLNSLPLYSSGLDQQDRHNPMFFNPLAVPMEKPRSFIDAWSNAETGESNVNANNKNSSAASLGKLSLTSLDLSMGGGNVNEDMGTIMELDGNKTQHNVDTTKVSLSNWLNPTPPWVASPLAEVLRPSTVTTTSDATSNQTMISSPSGVLHKTLASFSDSSDNSSPTVASSRVNSEIPLLNFN